MTVQIINGDCLVEMAKMPDNSVDLVILDPPYEIKSSAVGRGCLGKSITKKRNKIDFMVSGFDINMVFNQIQRLCKKFNIFCFCNNFQLSRIMAWGEYFGYSTTCLIWHKYNSIPLCSTVWRPDVEFIVHIREGGATFLNGNLSLKSRVDRLPIERSKFGHPTEKPLSLIEKFVQIGSKGGDLVLDPFTGTGTTLVAAESLGRNSIGIELSAEYCAIARARLACATGDHIVDANEKVNTPQQPLTPLTLF